MKWFFAPVAQKQESVISAQRVRVLKIESVADLTKVEKEIGKLQTIKEGVLYVVAGDRPTLVVVRRGSHAYDSDDIEDLPLLGPVMEEILRRLGVPLETLEPEQATTSEIRGACLRLVRLGWTAYYYTVPLWPLPGVDEEVEALEESGVITGPQLEQNIADLADTIQAYLNG